MQNNQIPMSGRLGRDVTNAEIIPALAVRRAVSVTYEENAHGSSAHALASATRAQMHVMRARTKIVCANMLYTVQLGQQRASHNASLLHCNWAMVSGPVSCA
jgi:hypothetical protein